MKKGRPQALTPGQIAQLEAEWRTRTPRQWAALLKVSHVTVYNYAHQYGWPVQAKTPERKRFRPPTVKRGRPPKVTPDMVAVMRAGWLTRTTNHWSVRFGISRATVMAVAKQHHFPPRQRGPRDRDLRLMDPVPSPTPRTYRCAVCYAIYRKACPNGHTREMIA